MAGKSQVKFKPSGSSSAVSKGYLFVYNITQFLGWSYLFFQFITHYINGGGLSDLWKSVNFTLLVFQNGAVLEIVNVALGLVKSNLGVTFAQVFSRVMCVCGVLLAAPPSQVSIGFPLLLTAWCVTEIIRYLYYALNLINMVPYFLIWCRYTFFYFLYPIGVTGELLCYYSAQAYVNEKKLWTVEFPNALNFSFSYYYTLLIIMALYIPLFPQMYLHMFSQRRKVLGGQSKKNS